MINRMLGNNNLDVIMLMYYVKEVSVEANVLTS